MIYNKELTLNSLLVKHQNGNRDWGKIVPSSHNRNELRHIIIRPFIGVFNTINSLLVTERFLQLLILGIRSSVGSGFIFQTFVQQNKSIIRSSFLSLDLHTNDTHL